MAISLNNHETRITNLEKGGSGNIKGVVIYAGGVSGDDCVGNGTVSTSYGESFCTKNGTTYTFNSEGTYLFEFDIQCGCYGESVDGYGTTEIFHGTTDAKLYQPKRNAHAVWWNTCAIYDATILKLSGFRSVKIKSRWWGAKSPRPGLIKITKLS